MELNIYQEKAIVTAQYGAGPKIIYPALGLSNEAGEVLGKIKKVLRDKNGEFTTEECEKIGAEIGDTLWYIAALANDLGLKLEDIAQNNLTKLADRHSRGKIQGDGDNR